MVMDFLLAASPRQVALGEATEPALAELLTAAYDLEADDARLRSLHDQPAAARAAGFRDLRKHYPRRREFGSTRVQLSPDTAALALQLRAIGFQTA